MAEEKIGRPVAEGQRGVVTDTLHVTADVATIATAVKVGIDMAKDKLKK